MQTHSIVISILNVTVMRKIIFLAVMQLLWFFSPAQSDAFFLSNPCLTPDGQTVIFSFEGDLWKANIKDGQAARLTAMQGYETSAWCEIEGVRHIGASGSRA